MRNIYVASSWRNTIHPRVVEDLRKAGHDVYDFKDSSTGGGFGWHQIDPEWEEWTVKQYLQALQHPLAIRGYLSDFNAMKEADTFVLVLPCGRSAHLELGWACGQGKTTAILLSDAEPELMVKMVDYLCTSMDELLDVLR